MIRQIQSYFIIATILLWVLPGSVSAQKRKLAYQAEISGIASDSRVPFWLKTNTYGKIADDAYLLGNFGLFSGFTKENTRAFDFSLGFEGTGALGKVDNHIFVNQLYGRARWQNLVLDLGMLNRPTEYDGLSASNGDLLFSNNTRSLPGISLSTYDYIKFPFIGKWLSFRAKYAEHIMIDKRYEGNRLRLHNKLLALKITVVPQFSLEGGIDHYAQWGGTIPEVGKLPHGLKDYWDIVAIKGGSEDAPKGEQINKMGNHIGMHFAKLKYNGEKIGVTLNYNHMFEDGSGMKFKNFPDGLYGIYITRKNQSKWFKSFLYELYYTKDQSGPYHNDPVTGEVVGGNDSYFNHYIYRTGWTYYGQTIGAPFFTPSPAGKDDITLGVYNNRFIAHHFGICGDLPLDIRYKLMFSYSLNYGQHELPFLDDAQNRASRPQFSFGAEFIAPDFNLPFNTALSVGFDKGDLLKNNFGVMLKIFKIGVF